MKLNRESNLDLFHAHDAVETVLSLRKFFYEIDSRSSNNSNQILIIIDSIEKLITSTPDLDNLIIWRLTIAGLRLLDSHLKCRNIAQGKSGNIVEEREKLAFLCDEFTEISQEWGNSKLEDSQIVKQDRRSVNAARLIDFLRLLPLPVTYLRHNDTPSRFPTESGHDEKMSPLVRLIAFIDGSPLVSPQLLQPKLSYSLAFEIHGVLWHEDAERLYLRLESTCPVSNYSISSFVLSKPQNIEGYDYQGKLNGQIQFEFAQSILSDVISFIIVCAFELSDRSFYEVPVIGYNQLEFRVFDSSHQLFLSGYNRLDFHVAQLISRLLHDHPNIRDEMTELIPVIEALSCLLGVYAQGAVFRETVSMREADFQKRILNDLRFRLGEDVKEGLAQAGGFTDIVYRGVIIELKVERNNGDRQRICQKYTRQSTQYEGVESRQVSILLVLDLTPKENPPGDIRNDILLVDVPTHGGDDSMKRYPSKSFVFVVNGNIMKPSDYS